MPPPVQLMKPPLVCFGFYVVAYDNLSLIIHNRHHVYLVFPPHLLSVVRPNVFSVYRLFLLFSPVLVSPTREQSCSVVPVSPYCGCAKQNPKHGPPPYTRCHTHTTPPIQTTQQTPPCRSHGCSFVRTTNERKAKEQIVKTENKNIAISCVVVPWKDINTVLPKIYTKKEDIYQ